MVSFVKREQSHTKWLCSEGTATNWIAASSYVKNSEICNGRIIKHGNTFEYEYNIKDHLGNVRVRFADKDNWKINNIKKGNKF